MATTPPMATPATTQTTTKARASTTLTAAMISGMAMGAAQMASSTFHRELCPLPRVGGVRSAGVSRTRLAPRMRPTSSAGVPSSCTTRASPAGPASSKYSV